MTKPGNVVLLLAISAILSGPPALATDRDRTVELLESAGAKLDAELVEAWANEDRGSASAGERTLTPLDSTLSYHFVSQRDAFLTALHVNSQGDVTVLFPRTAATAMKAGEKLDFPPSPVVLPLGNDDLYVFATGGSLTLGDLGLDGEFPLIERDAAPDAVKDILDRVAAAEPFASARVSSRVVGRVRTRGSNDPEVRAEDIITFFAGARTRGQKRANVDLAVHFDTNSAVLTGSSVRLLDEVGKAFSDERMAQFTFIVGGHTDVRGSDDLNRKLSWARAEATQLYLVEKHGITVDRLEVKAYGESEVMRSEESEDAHAENRRVEFRWINDR